MSDYFKKRMEELGLSDNESTSGSTQKQSNYFVERVKALGLDQVSSKASASGSPKWSAPTEKNSAVDEGRNILLGYDLNAGSSTIKELETKYNEAKKIQDAIDERVALVLYGQSRAGNLQASRENVMASDNVVAELQKQLAAYGDLDALEKDLKEKKRYHTLAERAQNGVKLASVVENEDFLENSKYVSTEIKRETFWDRFRKGEYGLGYEDLTHQYINGDEDFRAEVGRKHATYSMDNVFDDGESRFEEANLDQMNADEIKIYNYHYNTGGKEKAEEYLDSIQETLNYRKAEKEFALYEDNVALELMFGVEAGLDQFESGIENLFSNEDYIPTSDTQMTSGMVREDLADSGAKLPEWLGGSSVGQVGYDLVTNTSNMLPSILTSAVSNVVVPGSGAITGSVLLGASASGNAYAEMVNLGYTKGQARAYSTLVGASEAALQYALGGISKLGGKVSGNAVSKLVSKIDNAFARTAIKLGGNMASEGLEEAIQTALEPAFKALATGEDFESAEWDEILYSALLGAVSGGIFEGADIGASHVSTAINDYKVGKDIISKAEAAENFDSVAALKSLAYEMAGDQKTFADKQLAKTAGKIDYMNLKAGNVGKTQRLVSESISKQNAADIQKALVEKGLSNKESAQIAEYLLRASEGQLYSDSEREQAKIEAKIAGDDRIVDVLRDVIGNPDSDVNARWGNLHNALQGGKQTTADTQTSAPVQEATPEVMKGDHKVSESGKTLYTNENGETEEVNIQKIVSTDGGIKVALDNGKTVNAKDLELSTDAEAMAFEMVTRMEATPETAQVIFEAVKASDATSAEELFLGVPTAYRYGKINYEAGLANISIPDAIKKLAYNRGKVDAMTSPKSKKKVASKQTKKTNAKKSETKQYSKVIFEGFEYSEDSATDIQKASMKAIDALSKMSNFLEIHVYESKVVNGERYAIVDGKKITANGYFKVGTNKVYVDINAGNKGEGLSLYTLGHEVTHPIAEWNWEDFKKLGDFLIENFGKNNVPVDELINEKMKVVANSYKLDGQAVPSENKLFMEAYEEVVADSMSSMFADPNSYVKLAEFKKQDKTLWQKFGDVIKAILDKLKSLLGVYDGVSYESKEAEHVSKFSRDVYDKLQDLYIKAFVGAEANYQASNLVSIDTASESVSPKFSERTWSESEYVTEREETAKKIAQALGVDIKTAYKYIDDINGVARLIADDRARLDYEPNLDEKASVLKPNSEYKFSVDMSTLCAKRLLFTGTFDAIQKALPNTVFDSEDIVSLREMMQKRGYEVACGICYVESTRREIGRITQEFIDRYKVAQKTGKPISRINSSGKEVVLKSAGRTFSADKNYTPNLGELNTTDIDFVKRDHREVYDAYLAFMNARGQAKPKLLETRAEYKGEILKHFKAKSAVEARNNAGGLRLQSFSDFEVPHMIDMMQIVMDMSRVGLKSQAYTKVPAFAEVFGDSGVKINLSLIAKGDGLDAKGNLIFDDVEGINHEEAFNLRDKYSKNVGTILVGKTDAHIIAAMADPRIDYIIPFHKSSWKESLYDALGLTGYADYTDFQNEKPIDKDRKISNFDPSEYWDFTKTGDENAQTYLDKCREDGRIPKFPQFQGYPGYWKLLIDFKMYDNDGVGSPQEVVKPVFNTEASERILNAYEGGHKSFPVAKDVVEDFVKEHSENNGVKYSLRVKYTNGTEIIANPYETTREQVLEFMQMARKGQLENYSYFPVSSDTSKTIISTLKNAGIIVENRPLAMQVDKARQSQINAKPINKNGFTIRYHAMSAEKILEVINNLDDAIAIIQQRNRTTTKEIDGEKQIVALPDNFAVFVALEDGKEYVAVIEFDAKIKSDYILADGNGDKYHTTVTVFEPDVERDGEPFDYIEYLLLRGDNQELDIIKENPELEAAIRQTEATAPKKEFSDKSISQDSDSVKRKMSEREIVDISNNDYVKMYNHFGSTKNYDVAGYMLGNGVMLDFRGKHWGDDYSTSRQVDHRDIQEVLGNRGSDNGVNAMIDMIGNGNIRLMPEVGGINLAVKPNPTQMAQLRGYINHFKGEVVVDIDKVGGDTIHSFEYTRGTSSSKILADIKAYFDEGIVPEQQAKDETDIRQFLYSERTTYAPTFYSYMGKVVDGIKSEKVGANGVVPYLKGKGVKDEEIKWSGIEAFLEGKKSVTKAELQEFVAGSQLQIEEEMSGDDIDLRYDGSKRAYNLLDENGKVLDTFTYNEFLDGYVAESDEEVYLNQHDLIAALRDEYGKSAAPRWADYKFDGGSNYRELVFKLPNSTYSNQAMRTHWGDDAEGVLAHARIQDMTSADGKKMLFVEEIQSDWHNEGHTEGYGDPKRATDLKLKALALDDANKVERRSLTEILTKHLEGRVDAPEAAAKSLIDFKVDDRNGNIYVHFIRKYDIPIDLVSRMNKLRKSRDEAISLHSQSYELERGVPDAPFRDTYHEYVLKRLLRMAAEEGYDSIGWTTADIQSKRWSEDYAEGYRIEYDQDIPKFLKKYGKKWGAEVGKTMLDQGWKADESGITLEKEQLSYWQTELSNAPSDSADFIRSQISYHEAQIKAMQASGESVWSMDITDSMKDSVLNEGQVMYSERVTDKETLDFLNGQIKRGEYITVYRSFQVIDGGLYAPMNAVDRDENGKNKRLGYKSELGKWEKATESRAIAQRYMDAHPDAPYAKFDLDGGDNKTGGVAYNPYLHATNLVLNDQFSAAYRRSLVTVECRVPLSEADSAYKADYAKDGTGWANWKAGGVAGQLKKLKPELERRLFLSRYMLPVRILSDAEVATMYKEYLDGTDIPVPWNVVTPSLRRELEKAGVNISYKDVKQSSGSLKFAEQFPEEASKVSYQERDPDSISNRSLLANALESAAKEGEERNILRNYKTNLRLLEAEQAKLADVRQKAHDMRFKKGRTAEETKALNSLDFEAKQIAKRINTYDRELLKIEAMKPIKDVLNREKQMAYKRAEQKGKEALKKQRERESATYKKLLAEHQESRKKAIEGRHKTEMRHKIKKVVGDLNTLLLNPTKDKHVPIGLQLVVADALDAINMDTMNAAERVAYYNDRIAKSNNPDEIEMLTKKRDFFEYRDMNFKDKVTALKNAYAEFKNSDDPLIRNAHNEAIANLIENTSDVVGKKSLKDMSYEQLEAVYNMYKAILATVRNANKMFKEGKQETITENSESVKREVKEVGGHRDRVLKATKFLKKFGWDMLKPVTAMKVIGSDTLASLFDNVRAGEDTWAVDVSEAKAYYEGISAKYRYKDWDFKKHYTFKDSAGNNFSLSLEQIMSLYAYSKREQADKHLEFGGFIFDDAIEVTEKTKIGIPMKYEVNDANPYRLRREDLLAVIDSLSAEQKGFVDEMQSYLSDVMGAKGNEVSLAMYDIKLYNEKNYFPLKTSRYFREFDPEKSATPKIKNAGFSKKTVPQAGNPIVLSNFMDVWANHVNDMSMYHAFVLPLEDFTRVYNYSSTAGGYDSVQQYIKNAYGSQANQYIERLLDDLNGGARVDSSAGIINKGISMFKKASVFASASVVIQQPSAIARAFAYINPKYFAGATGSALNLAKHKELWAEAKKYAPVAVIKEMGYFDTGIGRSSVDWIKGNQTIMDKADDVLSKAPAIADELAWTHIWLAVKREVKATTNLKEGSEEFLKKAGERFTEVIVNTQVYDSVLSRSGMMRSKDTGMKMATAFMAEPTTTANMMIDGIVQGKRGNKKFLAATVGGVSASIVLNSILVALVYAARDDDEDETYLEKYLGSLTSELLDGFNPLTYIPFVKDIWSIAQGYDVERSDMTVVSNLWESIERMFNENTSGWKKVADVSGAVSSLFGIPLKNIIRDAKGLYNLFETVTSGIPTTEAGIGNAVEDAFKSSIPLWDRFHETETNSDKLYDAIMSGDQAQIDRIKDRFKDEDAVESAFRNSVKGEYVDGDLSRSEAEKLLVQHGDLDRDEAYWKLKEWDYFKQNGTTDGYSKYSDFYTAVQTGRNLKSVISEYTSHGVEAKTLASQITSYFKPLYKKMSNSERASLKGYLLNAYVQLGYNRADKSKDINAWLKD